MRHLKTGYNIQNITKTLPLVGLFVFISVHTLKSVGRANAIGKVDLLVPFIANAARCCTRISCTMSNLAQDFKYGPTERVNGAQMSAAIQDNKETQHPRDKGHSNK